MRRLIEVLVVGSVGLVLGLAEPTGASHIPSHDCPPDSVRAGTACIDKYEASVWQIKPIAPATTLSAAQKTVINKIRAGTVTQANLTGIGATPLGLASGDLADAGCAASGAGCTDVYAVSIAGVTPAARITWFQASAAARNSFKRLPTNAEWQAAALGTPDPGTSETGSEDCNTANAGGLGNHEVVPTGSRSNCLSEVGTMDMVGNLWEWVAEWVPVSTACPGWGGFSDDQMCLAGAGTTGAFGPGPLVRGGSFELGAFAGVFAINGSFSLWDEDIHVGFRAAR